MTVTIEGSYPKLERVVTGLHSFDLAVGNPFTKEIGLPLRCIVEAHGLPFSGKSTFSYMLAACINPKGTIVPVDFDGFDLDYLKRVMEGVGFDGTVRIVSEYDKENKPRAYADMLMDMARALREENVTAGILDSVSTYQSIHEADSEVGESSMGRRAQEIGQFCRKALNALRDPSVPPKTVIVVNHGYAKIGGHGTATAGGRVLEASKAVSFSLYRKEKLIKEGSDRDDFIIEGRTTKLRYGGIGRSFLLACILGRGIHIGMTAVLDCVTLGLATREGTVKLGKTSMGRIRTLVDAAAEGNDKVFEPFIEALKKPAAAKKKGKDDIEDSNE